MKPCEARALFDALDVDGSGSVSPAELSLLLFGKTLTEEEEDDIITTHGGLRTRKRTELRANRHSTFESDEKRAARAVREAEKGASDLLRWRITGR